MESFLAEIHLVAGNPFVYLPEGILCEIFRQAGKSKGPIPICGTLNGLPYKQTLVKYAGEWRMYINMTEHPPIVRTGKV